MVAMRYDVALKAELPHIHPTFPETTICCPFHGDRNPSCYVNMMTGLFHCKSCPAHGDFLILWQQLTQQFDGIQSVMQLRNVPGIFADLSASIQQYSQQECDEVTESEKREQAARRAYWIYSQMEEVNWHTVEDHYLLRRGFTPETLNHFQVRLNPNYGDHSIVIPLYHQYRFQGFVARRDVDGVRDKYRNSKGFSRKGVIVGDLEVGTVILTEGFTDRMMLRQWGVNNVASLMGNMITDIQLQLLRRYAKKVISCMHNDQAGRTGLLALKMALESYGIPVIQFPYPDGVDDIAEMSEEQFRSAWIKIDSQYEFISFEKKLIAA